jgi:hypothetical protein
MDRANAFRHDMTVFSGVSFMLGANVYDAKPRVIRYADDGCTRYKPPLIKR